MTVTKGLIHTAATSALDTRKADAAKVVTDTSGNPRVGVLTPLASIVTSDASTAPMRVAVAKIGIVTQRAAGDGVAIWTNDGSIFLTITKPGSNSHYVTVFAKHHDTASGDLVSTPEIGVVTGSASATPSEAALPAGALKLATILVPSTATSSQSAGVVITQSAQYTAMAGGAVPFRTRAEMDGSGFAATIGQKAAVFADSNTALRGEWVYDGTRWRPGAGVELVESWTYNQAAVDGAFQSLALGDDAGNTTDGTLASVVATGIQIAVPGVYHLSVDLNLPANAGGGGLNLIQIGDDASAFCARTPIPTLHDRASTSRTIRTTGTNVTVPLKFIKNNGSLDANTGRVMLTRLS